MPGEDWLKAILDKWPMSCKIPSTLEKSHKTATSNPTIIYVFYDILEAQLKQLKIESRSECLCNVHKTNLYIDPQMTRVVVEQGSKASRVSTTRRREDIPVMAGISAEGKS